MLIRFDDLTYVEGNGISSVQAIVADKVDDPMMVEIRHAGNTEGVLVEGMTLDDVIYILENAGIAIEHRDKEHREAL